MFSPKSVFITGANRGIGLEFVKQFLELSTPPQHVFAGSRDPGSATVLKALAMSNATLTIVKLDVTDEKTIQEAKILVGNILGNQGLTLLINNAGVANKPSDDKLSAVTAESMIHVLRVNTVGTLMVSKAFIPLLEKAASVDKTLSIKKAAIVNLSSGAGSITDNDMGSGYAYRTSKAGLNMITKNLSIDIKSSGILVVALHPGWVKTDMGGPRAQESPTTCVGRMMGLMATFEGEDKTGLFYHNKGHVIPW